LFEDARGCMSFLHFGKALQPTPTVPHSARSRPHPHLTPTRDNPPPDAQNYAGWYTAAAARLFSKNENASSLSDCPFEAFSHPYRPALSSARSYRFL
jgi:hypothetical protein